MIESYRNRERGTAPFAHLFRKLALFVSACTLVEERPVIIAFVVPIILYAVT